jgi:hypothetical protein
MVLASVTCVGVGFADAKIIFSREVKLPFKIRVIITSNDALKKYIAIAYARGN